MVFVVGGDHSIHVIESSTQLVRTRGGALSKSMGHSSYTRMLSNNVGFDFDKYGFELEGIRRLLERLLEVLLVLVVVMVVTIARSNGSRDFVDFHHMFKQGNIGDTINAAGRQMFSRAVD